MLVMRLVFGPNFMVISIMDILLYAKVSPLYNVLQECIVITKYGSIYFVIGMNKVLAHYACTFENSHLPFHFQ